MQCYMFKYRKIGRLLWKCVKVKGHNMQPQLDRIELFLADGGILSIPQWSKYICKLGPDWELAIKKQMEKEAGQPIVTE